MMLEKSHPSKYPSLHRHSQPAFPVRLVWPMLQGVRAMTRHTADTSSVSSSGSCSSSCRAVTRWAGQQRKVCWSTVRAKAWSAGVRPVRSWRASKVCTLGFTSNGKRWACGGGSAEKRLKTWPWREVMTVSSKFTAAKIHWSFLPQSGPYCTIPKGKASGSAPACMNFPFHWGKAELNWGKRSTPGQVRSLGVPRSWKIRISWPYSESPGNSGRPFSIS
mmetsp:Transcript_1892/g.4467  ORF Transcript_1892/g.4467 Transcript_1892/m.4467 type:complete len:219 (+) Transcript_1892:93-749(+)